MRRTVLSLMAVAMLMATSGCISVSVIKRFSSDPAVVAVDGHVYVVDTRSGKVQELDISSATDFIPEEPDDDEDDD